MTTSNDRKVRAPTPAATADGAHASCSDAELSGTALVYRKLGQMLVRDEKTKQPGEVSSDSPIFTHFVVRIYGIQTTFGPYFVVHHRIRELGREIRSPRQEMEVLVTTAAESDEVF